MYTLVLYIDHIHRYRRWKVAFTSATPRKLEHTVQSGPTSMNLDVLYVQITWQWHAISNYTYPFMSLSKSTPRFSDWAWPCPCPRHVSRNFSWPCPCPRHGSRIFSWPCPCPRHVFPKTSCPCHVHDRGVDMDTGVHLVRDHVHLTLVQTVLYSSRRVQFGIV